ncbi:RNA polymerase sigma-70 factor, ECF subfamily [Paenibacillus sp. 1_12]|uniref:sigma-70 family RNA polymerase sigma factor n=1 Tax=Paenibacillus sp. 1_12 TaxID=1566278 RepID=UPI0008EF05B7|nr:sigma-70 family RNA polymerase sigma factor [Paenibacillus sp. 1_12]SFL77610.1 RNA polymerase sigma-70 factor, ECF subfamily [Paenibacillus sp. 1_12]
MEITQVNMGTHYNQKDDVHDQIISKEEFSRIYEMYSKRVYKYICYRINNHYAAEDICSHVFEKVITKYHSFSQEKSKFEVWLFAIVRNSVTDYYRAQKKGTHFSLNNLLNMVFIKSSPEELAIRDDNNQELFKALAKLRDKERNILAMKYAAGLKNSEIAQLMGVSESNIGVVVYRSLKKLHKTLVEGGFKNE